MMNDATARQIDAAPQLVWYFDVISPFAYLALPDVLRLAADHPVTMRPVLFSGLLSHWGQLGPAEIGPKRVHTYRLAQFQAQKAGLLMRFPPRHPFRSLDVMRMLTALHNRPDPVQTAFEFIWAEGRDPSDPAEQEALWYRLGVTDAAALLNATEVKQRLRANTEEAAALGVFGVPTLAVDGVLFWGADAMPMARAYLRDPTLFSRGEMRRLAELPVGVERRRE